MSILLAVTTLSVNGSNAPRTRHRLSEWIKKKESIIAFKKPTLNTRDTEIKNK